MNLVSAFTLISALTWRVGHLAEAEQLCKKQAIMDEIKELYEFKHVPLTLNLQYFYGNLTRTIDDVKYVRDQLQRRREKIRTGWDTVAGQEGFPRWLPNNIILQDDRYKLVEATAVTADSKCRAEKYALASLPHAYSNAQVARYLDANNITSAFVDWVPSPQGFADPDSGRILSRYPGNPGDGLPDFGKLSSYKIGEVKALLMEVKKGAKGASEVSFAVPAEGTHEGMALCRAHAGDGELSLESLVGAYSLIVKFEEWLTKLGAVLESIHGIFFPLNPSSISLKKYDNQGGKTMTKVVHVDFSLLKSTLWTFKSDEFYTVSKDDLHSELTDAIHNTREFLSHTSVDGDELVLYVGEQVVKALVSSDDNDLTYMPIIKLRPTRQYSGNISTVSIGFSDKTPTRIYALRALHEAGGLIKDKYLVESGSSTFTTHEMPSLLGCMDLESVTYCNQVTPVGKASFLCGSALREGTDPQGSCEIESYSPDSAVLVHGNVNCYNDDGTYHTYVSSAEHGSLDIVCLDGSTAQQTVTPGTQKIPDQYASCDITYKGRVLDRAPRPSGAGNQILDDRINRLSEGRSIETVVGQLSKQALDAIVISSVLSAFGALGTLCLCCFRKTREFLTAYVCCVGPKGCADFCNFIRNCLYGTAGQTDNTSAPGSDAGQIVPTAPASILQRRSRRSSYSGSGIEMVSLLEQGLAAAQEETAAARAETKLALEALAQRTKELGEVRDNFNALNRENMSRNVSALTTRNNLQGSRSLNVLNP